MMLDPKTVREFMKEKGVGMNIAHTLVTRTVILRELNDAKSIDEIKGVLFTILHEQGWDTSEYE